MYSVSSVDYLFHTDGHGWTRIYPVGESLVTDTGKPICCNVAMLHLQHAFSLKNSSSSDIRLESLHIPL